MVKAASYQIEKLNPKEIPVFLAHLSTAKDPDNFNRKHNLFILNALVRIHGRNIIPYINPIMSTVIQSLQLSHNHSNFAFHGMCSQLVLQIANYGIDPMRPDSENRKFVSSQKNVASVCAFCIRAVVESKNWKYASDELVNKICLEVVGALREEVEPTRTGTHLRLAISLVKQSPLVVEPYAKSLIQSGLFFLTDGGPQSKLLSLEMIHSIIKCVHLSSICSEIGNIINVLQNLANDSLLVMSGAVVEVLETIKTLEARRSMVLETSLSQVTGLGSREQYPMKVMIVGSSSNIGGIGFCIMHDRCDKCMFGKSSNQLHQRIRPHNSSINQLLQNQFSLSPNFLQSQVPLISPESAQHSGNTLQSISSETEMKRVVCGNLDGTCMPSCEACGGWKKLETKSRKDKGGSFGVLDLVLGCLDFIFCYDLVDK